MERNFRDEMSYTLNNIPRSLMRIVKLKAMQEEKTIKTVLLEALKDYAEATPRETV